MQFATVYRWACAFLLLGILGGCGGGGGGSDSTGGPPAPTLQSIAVTPGTLTAAVGVGYQLKAVGTYSDSTTRDLTASVTWTSSTPPVATVGAGGLVTGVSGGSATISASSAGVSGNSTVTIMDNTWVTAASAPVYLNGQTATLLADGTVLADGGDPTQSPPGAAVYDPVANAWTPTGPTATSRYNNTATLLKDGRVLVVGGAVLNGGQPNQVLLLSSAEIYDPKAKTWSLAAPLPAPREAHAAVLLGDGRVLVVGGDNSAPPPLDALLYDPSNNTWTSTTPPLPIGDNPTATLLKSGKALVTYDFGGGTSALFDPTSNSWETGPNTNSPHLYGATATLLNDGRVLVVGGLTGPPPAASTTPPELYDPTANSWSMAGTMNTNRVAHVAALLPSGKVLAAGGRDGNESTLATAELYDPNTNTWSAAASMATPRANTGAVALPLGQVFVVGGNDNGAALLSSELYW